MGRMWPPQSVNTWPAPACRRVRATRWPPLRSATLAARASRDVHDLELEPVRVLEEHRVVARPVLRELARGLVERGQPARGEELLAEAVHVLSALDAEGHVIEPRPLAVEAVPGVGRRGRDHPDVGPARREARDGVGLVHGAVVEVAEEGLVERERAGRVADVDLDVVDLGLHQNFSHLTLLRSMPFFTSTSRTRLMVSPPPQT